MALQPSMCLLVAILSDVAIHQGVLIWDCGTSVPCVSFC